MVEGIRKGCGYAGIKFEGEAIELGTLLVKFACAFPLGNRKS